MVRSFEDYAKKKETLYQERNETLRQEFISEIKKLEASSIVYIDEAGIDNRLFREYARAPRGQKVIANIPGKKRERISIIGALRDKKFIAPLTFTGGCNADVFNAWLEQILLPILPEGTTIIMDNAAFHKSIKTKELITQAKCRLLFLPTYSPDLNLIENCWHKIKSILRPIIQNSELNIRDIIDTTLSYI